MIVSTEKNAEMPSDRGYIWVQGASEHNLKNLDVKIPRGKIVAVTGVSGSGKSSLVFDTVLAECQRRFFYTLSNYSRQFLDLGTRPAVRKITGLSPAISLEQNETQPSSRATVATLTDIGELLGVLFARFGERLCPTHLVPTTSQSPEEIFEKVLAEFDGKLIGILVEAVKDKKGTFLKLFDQALRLGCQKAVVDGKLVSIDPPPKLKKENKHTVHFVIDYIKVADKSKARFLEAVSALSKFSGNSFLVTTSDLKGKLNIAEAKVYSLASGCSHCGYAWSYLDSRYFSANSLGKCSSCAGYGAFSIESEDQIQGLSVLSEYYKEECSTCLGTGIKPAMNAVRVLGKGPVDLHNMSLEKVEQFLIQLREVESTTNPAFWEVVNKLSETVRPIVQMGLGYLSLSRRIKSLSGGEAQRLKLANILGEKLTGVIYVLDEPSQGLHPHELDLLWEGIKSLKASGNTVLLVDHDLFLIERSDLVIDMGPTGGSEGGYIESVFTPSEISSLESPGRTASALLQYKNQRSNLKPEAPLIGKGAADAKNAADTKNTKAGQSEHHKYLTFRDVEVNNLKAESIRIRLGSLNVVTGVSGAGKSSFVFGVLSTNLSESAPYVQKDYEIEEDWYFCDAIEGYENVSEFMLIDRKPIAKSTVSMPATYLDCFKHLREFFGKLPESQIAGITAKHFSLSSDLGRCTECKGKGYVTLSMRFLSDAKETCEFCGGKRYLPEILDVKYKGYSIADFLDLTIGEVYELLKHNRQIERRLKPAISLGLGYLKFGQPSITLSGGEAQRLKMVPLLTKNWGKGSLLVLDEPTRGLHTADVEVLLTCIRQLIDSGATVVLIEHSPHVIYHSDWLIDIGPGASEMGGKVVFEGELEGLLKATSSVTAKYLL